jgi:hypothetical protein
MGEARCTCGGRGICTICILDTLRAQAMQLARDALPLRFDAALAGLRQFRNEA